MKSVVVRRYECEGCGAIEFTPNPSIHGPEGWREVLDDYTLCTGCVELVDKFIKKLIGGKKS